MRVAILLLEGINSSNVKMDILKWYYLHRGGYYKYGMFIIDIIKYKLSSLMIYEYDYHDFQLLQNYSY